MLDKMFTYLQNTNEKNYKTWFLLLIVFLVCVGFFAVFEWFRPLLLPDEGRYGGVAFEMFRNKEYLVPTLNSLPYFHKPPLFYWIDIAAMNIFGLNEFSIRMAPLIGAVIGVYSIFVFVRRFVGVKTSLLMFILMITQPLIFVGSQYANLDMLVAGCITACITSLATAALLQEDGKSYKTMLCIGYFFAAAGFLAKGLIGFILPALIIFLWLVSFAKWNTIRKMLSYLPAWGIFLIFALPWCIFMQLKFSNFFHYFIIVQHFDRFAETGFNNAQAWWFFLAIIFVAALPFWFGIISAMRLKDFKYDNSLRQIHRLMWIWLAVIILFFSLPTSKLVGYIIPAAFPLCFIASDSFIRLQTKQFSEKRAKIWKISILAYFLLCMVAVFYTAFFPPKDERALSSVLKKQHVDNEPIYMVKKYYFSLPFYANLKHPVFIVDDWNSPDIAKHDNWRKEIADAGKFDLAAAKKYLILSSQFKSHLCETNKNAWIILRNDEIKDYNFLNNFTPLASQKGSSIYKIDFSNDAQKELVCGKKADLTLIPAINTKQNVVNLDINASSQDTNSSNSLRKNE